MFKFRLGRKYLLPSIRFDRLPSVFIYGEITIHRPFSNSNHPWNRVENHRDWKTIQFPNVSNYYQRTLLIDLVLLL